MFRDIFDYCPNWPDSGDLWMSRDKVDRIDPNNILSDSNQRDEFKNVWKNISTIGLHSFVDEKLEFYIVFLMMTSVSPKLEVIFLSRLSSVPTSTCPLLNRVYKISLASSTWPISILQQVSNKFDLGSEKCCAEANRLT